ncbi:hypothetical protein AB0N14_04085 [Streptomyces sp. NPDC051104]|uniref:hypothetical protein n=1 Tax=Streptomyces sp. NPDC051104 TaxID=3155044 RepID=UPI00341CB951
MVRLEGLRPDDDGEAVVATVRPGRRTETGDEWAADTVEHVYRFDAGCLVNRMDLRQP